MPSIPSLVFCCTEGKWQHIRTFAQRALVSSFTVSRMALTETSREPGQEEIDVQRVSRAQQQTPPPISGKKHQRSSSPCPKTNSKRRTRSTDRSPTFKSPKLDSPSKKPSTPTPYEPFRPEDNWSCPNCGHHCWLCKLPSEAPPEQLELKDEAEFERARMASEPPPSSTDISCSKCPSKKRKKDHYMQLGISLIGPRDEKFKDCILDPLGVCWAKKSRPNGKLPLFLKSPSLPPSRVIINSDDKDLERIITEFLECKERRYNEHSLTLICCDSIILRDRLVENAFADEDDQELIVTSVRRDKWKLQQQGPAVRGSRFVYDWDLEPDTTYAVSIKMFNPEYRRKLHFDTTLQSWVAEKDVSVCPYLTIEYKSSDKGGKEAHATNQTIAAAILWLYQRKNLRKAIGQAFNDLSHFMITLIDSTYVISEARFKGDDYFMCRHISGDLTHFHHLKLYIEWSNAIHAWGLGANASSFKRDIEMLVTLRSAQTSSDLPTPAGTGSPMGPSVQKPGLSEQVPLHEKEEENLAATRRGN